MRAGLRRNLAAGLIVPLMALALALALTLAGCGATTNRWQAIGPTNNSQINALASDPHIHGIIYAGASDGTTYVARGDRSGVFVASEKTPGHDPVNVIFPNPYLNGTVYAGTAGGFYASSDYGVHYVAQNSGLPRGASVAAITTGPDANTVFASVATSGLYASDDGGKSWKPVASAPATGAMVSLPPSANVQALLWDEQAKALYAAVTGAGHGVYVSKDNGASWQIENKGLPPSSDALALLAVTSGGIAASGPTLYVGTSAGVYARASGGDAWQSASVGLPPGVVYSLAAYPPTPGLLYAGTAKAVYSSTDGGQQWTEVGGGLSHAVPAIVVVPGQHSSTVAFVAAGQIARYPPTDVGSGGILSTLLLVVIVGLTAWYILARYKIVPSYKDLRRRLTKRNH